ncbi:MAG: hypothetical protein K2W95_29100 [Candidatus Obscuribacterales bacterium]|nr:hypothetical protein [Candidatus Obscuribacterales bacterium]
MKKLFAGLLLAGVIVGGAATAANAQLFRDYCNWPYYSPYAGYNPNFIHSSSFTYGATSGGAVVRSGFTIQPMGSPYWDQMPAAVVLKDREPLIQLDVF